MDNKWADYAITAVEYNSQHTHIVAFEVWDDLGDTLGNPMRKTRQDIVKLIQSGTPFVMATKPNGKWTKGEDVRPILIGNTTYIRSDSNSVAKDNLGNLPELNPA